MAISQPWVRPAGMALLEQGRSMKDPPEPQNGLCLLPLSALITTSASRTPPGPVQVRLAISLTYNHESLMALTVFQMHVNAERSEEEEQMGIKGRTCEQEVETGDQSAEAQQS